MDINFDWSYWKEFENAFFNDKQYCTIASCRGSGKTFNGFQWILEELFAEPNSLGLWMDTTQKNIHDYIADYLQKQILAPIWNIIRYDRQGFRIELPNGSVLKFASAERPDLAEGFRYHRMILNEAGIILKKPSVWDNTLEPMTHPRDGRPNKTRLIGCIASNTYVFEEDIGIREIGRHETGYADKTGYLYGDGGLHRYEQVYGNGVSDTIRIKDNCGYELEGTPNHKILTPDGWKRLDELRVGDKTYIQVGQDVFGKKSEDLDYCYFLGLYLAEGSIEESIHRITITNTDLDVIEFLHKIGFKTCKDGIHHRINSKQFCNRWRGYYTKLLAGKKILTPEILTLKKECLAQVLSGYFDGDGHSDPNRMRVGCNSSSEKLIYQLQIALLNFGIVSYRTKYVTKPTKRVRKSCIGHRLEINGYASSLFHERIGFRITRKKQNDNGKRNATYMVWNTFNLTAPLHTKLCDMRYHEKLTWKRLGKIGITTDRFGTYITSIERSRAYTSDFVIPDTKQYCANGFISHNTPKGRNKFHQLASIENEDWAHYHFSVYDCPLYSDEEAERIKHGKPVEVWRQEYMAEFVEDAGMVFRNYSQCIRDIPQIDKGIGGKSYVVGIDLAKHTDFTVICVIDKESKELVHFERFNQIDWTFQKERIINIWNNFNNPQIVLDSTGVGDPIYNELQSSGLYIDGFRFTNSSKMELIRTLSIAFDNKGLYINNNEVLLNELGVFEYDITPSGNLTYSAPQGMHDDCVIALALANYGLKNTVVASIAAIPF